MARTLNADLLTAQVIGYPTGGYQPAVRCILTSKGGATTHDYSFNPTLNTNRLIHTEQIEERESDSGVILLSNYDRNVPDDITGYYVDLGWGLNTPSGVQWAGGAVAPRLWVEEQLTVSGGQKDAGKELYTLFKMGGVWTSVLNKQEVRLGDSPYFRYELHDPEDTEGTDYIIPALTNKTIYDCLEYLIETALSAQTLLTFTLDALGTQDDGHINTDIPFPTDWPLKRTINAETPGRFQTYGEVISSLMELTKCILVPRAGLAFKIVYPQASDTPDEAYYSSSALGHPFYEATSERLNVPYNHIEVFGTDPELVVGNWYDPDHWTSKVYVGEFMPRTLSISEEGLDTQEQADARADTLGRQKKDEMLGKRIIIPMDARVELYDRISILDTRGVV